MIYFLRAERDSGNIKAGWVKIRTSIRLSSRLQLLAYEIGHKPTVLGVLDGSYAEEHALHDQYAGFRRVGEWFDPTDSDLLSLIENESRPWDGKDDVPQTRTNTIKLHPEVFARAKIAATLMDISTAEYIENVLEECLSRDLARGARKLLETLSRERQHKVAV
jgi:hypothetical protein